jgi:hypothetical protein
VSPVRGLEQHVFSAQELADFATKPGILTAYRKEVESRLNGQFGIFLKDTKTNGDTHEYVLSQMKEKLRNEFLEERLIPN